MHVRYTTTDRSFVPPVPPHDCPIEVGSAPMRTCRGCKRELPRDAFYPSANLTRCRECHKVRQRKYHGKKRAERLAETNRELGPRGPTMRYLLGRWPLTSGVCMVKGCPCAATDGLLVFVVRPPSRALVRMCATHTPRVIDVCQS